MYVKVAKTDAFGDVRLEEDGAAVDVGEQYVVRGMGRDELVVEGGKLRSGQGADRLVRWRVLLENRKGGEEVRGAAEAVQLRRGGHGSERERKRGWEHQERCLCQVAFLQISDRLIRPLTESAFNPPPTRLPAPPRSPPRPLSSPPHHLAHLAHRSAHTAPQRMVTTMTNPHAVLVHSDCDSY